MAAPRLRVLTAGLLAGLVCAAAAAGVSPVSAPAWSGLDAHQRAVLAPLEDDWDGMSQISRRKWLGIAERHDRLSADEQARMQVRMKDWARLHPDQRARARERYRALRALPPEQRGNLNAAWERYQNLPPEARKAAETAPLRRPAVPLPSHSIRDR